MLKEIASEKNIVLQNEEESSAATEEKFKTEQKQNHPESTAISGGSKHRNGFRNLLNEIESMEGLSVSLKGARKYKDVTDAAEESFKLAAYAAAAARAAVKLSRSESHDPADHNSSGSVTDEKNLKKFKIQNSEENNLRRTKDQNNVTGFGKVHPIQRYHSDSEDEIHSDEKDEETKEGRIVAHSRPLEGIVCYASDDETRNERGGEQVSRIHELGFDIKHRLNINEGLGSGKFHTNQDEDLSEKDSTLSRSQKWFPLRSQAGLETESAFENAKADSSEGSRVQSLYQLNAGRRPVSVRTRRAQGC